MEHPESVVVSAAVWVYPFSGTVHRALRIRHGVVRQQRVELCLTPPQNLSAIWAIALGSSLVYWMFVTVPSIAATLTINIRRGRSGC